MFNSNSIYRSVHTKVEAVLISNHDCGDELFPSTNQSLYYAIPSPPFSHPNFVSVNNDISDDPLSAYARPVWNCDFRKHCDDKLSDPNLFSFPSNTKMPLSLSPYSNLRIISLGCMPELSGSIPDDISQLKNLTVLEISSTNLHGSIPWDSISTLANLRKIVITERCSLDYKYQGCCVKQTIETCKSFDSNGCCAPDSINNTLINQSVQVSIPPWIVDRNYEMSGTPNDQLIQINSANDICSGTRMEEIFTEKRFDGTGTRSYFTGNFINGTQLSKLTNLEHLEITDVALTGTLPTEIGLLTKLTHLSIRLLSVWDKFEKKSTAISDSMIPTEIGKLTNLKTLLLSGDPVPYQLYKRSGLDMSGEEAGYDGALKILQKHGYVPDEFNTQLPLNMHEAEFPQTDFTSWNLIHFRNGYMRDESIMCGDSLFYFKDYLDEAVGFFDEHTLNNHIGIRGHVLSDSFSYNVSRSGYLSFDFYRNPFGYSEGFSGDVPQELAQLGNLTTLMIAHSPKLKGEITSSWKNNLKNLNNFHILNTGLSGNVDNLPETKSESVINTIAYNEFSDGCRFSDDFLGAIQIFKSDNSGIRFGERFYPNRDIDFLWIVFDKFGISSELSMYDLVGDVLIHSGIPQRFLNVNETVIKTCNLTAGDIPRPTPTQFIKSSTVNVKEKLKHFERDLMRYSGYAIDEKSTLCGDDPIRHRRTYKMLVNDSSIWPTNTDPCLDSWPGVMCDPNGNIVGLVLSGRFGWNLNGPIPPSIGNFTELKYLDLSFNGLTSIPNEFANLKSLLRLDLSYNNIQHVPDFLIEMSQNFVVDVATVNSRLGDFRSWKDLYNNLKWTNHMEYPVALAEELVTTMNISRFFNSLEGNPIRSQPSICYKLEIDCSILKIGDGLCQGLSFEPKIIHLLGLDHQISNSDCHRSHYNRTKLESIANLAHPEKCDICNEESNYLGSVIAFSVLILLLVVGIILLLIYEKKINPKITTTIKVVIIYMQMISIMITSSVKIPIEFTPFLVPFYSLSFFIPDIHFACYIGNNVFVTTIITMEGGLMLMFIICVQLCIIASAYSYKLCISLWLKVRDRMEKYKCSCSKHENHIVEGSFITQAWDLFFIKGPFLVMVPVVGALTDSFVRVDIYSAKEMGLPSFFDPGRVDLTNIAKGGSGVILLIDIFVFFLIFFFFVYFTWLLYKAKNEVGDYYTTRLQFFVYDYRNGVYFWSLIELIGRCLIVLVHRANIDVYPTLSMNLIILLAMLAIQNKIRPYKLNTMNKFQAGTLFSQIFVNILLFIWVSIEYTGSTAAAIAAVTIFFCYFLILCCLIYLGYRLVTEIDHSNSSKDVGDKGTIIPQKPITITSSNDANKEIEPSNPNNLDQEQS